MSLKIRLGKQKKNFKLFIGKMFSLKKKGMQKIGIVCLKTDIEDE